MSNALAVPHNPITGEVVAVPRGAAAGTVARQDFGGQQLETRAETASTALAEQARAQVEAKFIMAMRRPRDVLLVRQRLLRDCERPSFAAVAIYNKPVGEGIEGPSIRFAEAAARAMGNIDTGVITIYEDAQKRMVQVSATDLEANLTYPTTIVVEKTVERSKLREGQRALATRMNASGRAVYIVEATDDDILNKTNALVSKALRTCLLRLIPGDIVDEALSVCRETMRNKAAEDPDAEIRRMTDAFAELRVTVPQLAEYLGHPVGETLPAEIVRMKGVYNAMKDGQTTWQAILDAKAEAAATSGTAATTAPAAAPAGKPSNLGDVARAAKATREAAQATRRPEPTPAPAGARDPGQDG